MIHVLWLKRIIVLMFSRLFVSFDFWSEIEHVTIIVDGQIAVKLGWRKLVRTCERIVGGSNESGSKLK
jgi:hypothetical protein